MSSKMSLIKSFFKSTKKIHFGRFDINTTEKQKISKMILANSDNCGDLICGKPSIVKNIIRNDDNIKFPIKKENKTNNPQLCCMFYDFDKCNDCFMK